MVTITIREKKYNSEYKYIIQRGAYAYTAFHTDKGFNAFLKRTNINLDNASRVTSYDSEEYGKVTTYYIKTVIEEISFWDMKDIPRDAIKFKGLSNGSYVDCYYIHTTTGSKIFRPNPNAKEVYKPLSLEEHLEYSRING